MLQEYDYLFKVTLTGPAESGKTALIKRYTKGEFQTDYIPTIGADFFSHMQTIQGEQVKLQLWDLSGHERFTNVVKDYFRRADAIILTCDLSDKDFVAKTEAHVKSVLNSDDNFNPATPIVLVGTKQDQLLDMIEKKATNESADVEQAKQAALKDAQEKLKELQDKLKNQKYNCVGYQLTSAKTGAGVNELFERVATSLVAQRVGKEQNSKREESSQPSDNSEPPSKLKKFDLGLWKHIKRHSKSYIFGFLLAAAIAAVLTVPVIGQALGLAGAIGFVVANTAWQLGLLATALALVGFAACVLGGILIDKIKNSRSHEKQERLLAHDDEHREHTDSASSSPETSSIVNQTIYDHPAGMGATQASSQPEQPGSIPSSTASPNPGDN